MYGLPYCVPTVFLLILVNCVIFIRCSVGDRSYHFTTCISTCLRRNCTKEVDLNRFSSSQSLVDHLTSWDCEQTCRYICMWSTVDEFVGNGWNVPQFYGKWPFVRLFGMQEPASVFFSLLNLAAFIYLARIVRLYTSPNFIALKRLWTCYSWLGIAAWAFSTIFHARDVPLTEKFDYFCAFALVLFGFYASLIRIFGPSRQFLYVAFGAPFLAFFVYHVNYLSHGRFDYGYHIRTSIFVGVINSVSWLGWCFMMKIRFKTHYVWKCALTILSASGLMLLELFDFPPILWIFDAHSLWHLGTSPLPILWAQFVLDDYNFLLTEEKFKTI